MYKLDVSGKVTLEKNKTGNLFTVLEGRGVVRVGGDSFDVKKEIVFILTTACDTFELEGSMFLIGSYDK
ncbi:cupin domain-containing protein [Gemella sanguinis]|uniref:hypothetical protein n=1 Tax=Gemella sanguinis TaxID=84135 RepID=UPI001E549388|nr:hypothetical protein [Gemella sanguinis]